MEVSNYGEYVTLREDVKGFRLLEYLTVTEALALRDQLDNNIRDARINWTSNLKRRESYSSYESWKPEHKVTLYKIARDNSYKRILDEYYED